MMRLNPELRRYIWQEFSLHRLIAMPVVLGIICFLATNESSTPAKNLIDVTRILGILLLGFWGGHKAAEAVLEEVNGSTWDFQRLSSLSPWTLTWGKLLGSPIYCWYGASMALAVYIGASVTLIPFYYVVIHALLLLAAALICHATALISSLQALQARLGGRAKLRIIGHHILGLVAGSFFLGMVAQSDWRMTRRKESDLIEWFGHGYDLTGFTTFFAFVLLFWLVAGIYWHMRTELRMRTGPWLWVAFVLFLMVFFNGFVWEVKQLEHAAHVIPPLIAFAVGLGACYAMTFLEQWNGVGYRRLVDSWKTRRMPDVYNLFPRWLATFLLTIPVAFWLMGADGFDSKSVLAVVTLLGFALRDIALLHYFKLHPEGRRATAAAFFYLFILYVLIPMLMKAFHLDEFHYLLLPLKGADEEGNVMPASAISAVVQAGIMIFLSWGRWKRYWR